MKIYVGKKDEFTSPNVRKIVSYENKEIGVLKVNDQFHAFENLCPHAGGPVCEGVIKGRVQAVLNEEKDLLIHQVDDQQTQLVCPWHGWEFKIESGACAGDPKYRLKKYQLLETDGELYIEV